MGDTMEYRLSRLEELVTSMQAELAQKNREIRELKDTDSIKRLQCAYGYYLERGMAQEIIDLFADHPDVSATFVEGTYLGLKGVSRYFNRMANHPPSFFHQVMQISPIITLSSDGLTAKGRWYGYGTICSRPLNGVIDPIYMSVIYEMEYIKQDGIWKIMTLAFQMHYAYQPSKELRTESAPAPAQISGESMNLSPDIWAEYDTQYPSGYIYPFHFRHPVTGKETEEAKYNAALQLKPSRFTPR